MKYINILTIFFSGGVVFLNLAHLISTNRNYEASWFMVIVFIMIAITHAAILLERDY